MVGRVPAERAVGHRRAAVVVVHPAALPGRVPAERAVGHGWPTIFVVHSPAASPGDILVFVSISRGDGKAVQYGCGIRPAASNHVVAVLVIVGKVRPIIAKQVAAEDGLVCIWVAGIGDWLAKAGVTALNSHAIF